MTNMLESKKGLWLLLLLVFMINLVETNVETLFNAHCQTCQTFGEKVASAAQVLEGHISFRNHDNTNLVALYGYSTSYFFALPLLLVGLGVALTRQNSIEPFRIFALAAALDYWISLPFFLLFPLPERWAYPDSEAILLSDMLSESLIEAIRPLSGLDNSFPSFHVSLSFVIIGVSYFLKLQFRHSILALGITIILSTFVLGIHWLPDIIAGLALGILSVALAVKLNTRLSRKTTLSESPTGIG